MDLSNVNFEENTTEPAKITEATTKPAETIATEENTTPPAETIAPKSEIKPEAKKTTTKKVLKPVEKTATGKPASDNPAPKIDTAPPIADKNNTADTIKKIKDDDTARAHSEMWVFSIDMVFSSLGYFVTGNPASRYEMTPSQKARYKEISFQYFKVASWGISPAAAFFMQTATIFGTIGMLIYFDYKQKKKNEKALFDAAVKEQQRAQEIENAKRQRAQELIQKEQEKREAAQNLPSHQEQNAALQEMQEREQERERQRQRAASLQKELGEYKTQTDSSKPAEPAKEPAKKQTKKNAQITDINILPNELPAELTAEYLANQHEILSTRTNFETYEEGHEYAGHYIKNNLYQREKYENLRRFPDTTKPSHLVRIKLQEFKNQGLDATAINKKIRTFLTVIRERFGFLDKTLNIK